MQFIAHRGNTRGPEPSFENKIDFLLHAYNECGAVETDVQTYNGKLYFGHDEPQQLATPELLTTDNWFCHAKDIESMLSLVDMGAHCFWHQEDNITLTSNGHIWCFPGVFPIHSKAIWLDLQGSVLPEDKSGIWGICGDRDKSL